ncbi:hypothetical protein ACRN9J_03500 [Shewanella baltica]|uniref:hypothetical protein n=1 Tax=Shewanella baltica TaxID=62322 RepID=UPI003D7B1EA7
MSKNYRVIDSQNGIVGSYLKMVCYRNSDLMGQVTALKWFAMTIVEMVVGTELLESFVITGSVIPYYTIVKDDSANYGSELHLSLHIPEGVITNILRNQIIELLYYKYSLQYLILSPVGKPYVNNEKNTIDCSRTRFRARKDIFYQFIALRRVYDLFWLVFNVTVDLIVFFVTTDIKFALLSALFVEAIRRLLRV